jgi:hypothetical protein
MHLIDYDQFFQQTEDFLVPEKVMALDFDSYCKHTLERHRGIRYSCIDLYDLYNFMWGMSRQINTLFKVNDVVCQQWMKICHVASSELILRRNNGTITPSPAALMQFTSLSWMADEHARTGNQDSEIFHLLKGTAGSWSGDRFTPSPDAVWQTDLIRTYILESLMRISNHQMDQYRKIPLQIGALLRLKGKPAAQNEIQRLMTFLESRPGSKDNVVQALIESRIPKHVYAKFLGRKDRGLALDNSLGL